MTFAGADNYGGVFDTTLGFGKKPAVLVVDFVNAYTTPGAPLYAPAVARAVRATAPLLAAARRRAVPVVYTRVVYSEGALEGGLFVRKIPVLRTLVERSPLSAVVEELSPRPGDVVIQKQYASAFFATPLASMLTAMGVDTVVLTGCSTSGCVRATAVDAVQHGLRVVVPRECVGDRAEGPHEANLFDIHSKYGDVVSREDVLRFMDGLAV